MWRDIFFPLPTLLALPAPHPPLIRFPTSATLNAHRTDKRRSAEAMSGATETTRNCGQSWAGGATVSVTRTSRVTARASFQCGPQAEDHVSPRL